MNKTTMTILIVIVLSMMIPLIHADATPNNLAVVASAIESNSALTNHLTIPLAYPNELIYVFVQNDKCCIVSITDNQSNTYIKHIGVIMSQGNFSEGVEYSYYTYTANSSGHLNVTAKWSNGDASHMTVLGIIGYNVTQPFDNNNQLPCVSFSPINTQPLGIGCRISTTTYNTLVINNYQEECYNGCGNSSTVLPQSEYSIISSFTNNGNASASEWKLYTQPITNLNITLTVYPSPDGWSQLVNVIRASDQPVSTASISMIFPISYLILPILFAFLIYANWLAPRFTVIDGKKQYIVTIEWMIVAMISGLIGVLWGIFSITGMTWLTYNGIAFGTAHIYDSMEPWLPLIIIIYSLYIMVRTLGKRYGF